MNDGQQLPSSAAREGRIAKSTIRFGVTPTVNALKANLPLEKLDGNSDVLAKQSASYLIVSGIWERLMNDALDY